MKSQITMVNRLTKYETKVLNRVINKTFENNDFNIFEIISDFNKSLSGFDKQYVWSPDQMAITICNFLIDKRLAEKAYPDKPAFERVLRWTDKGVRLKKYKNYQLYRFMVNILPEISRVTLWLAGIIAALWYLIQIFKSYKN